MDRFTTAYSKRLGRGFVVCRGNLEVDGDLIYLPAYMAHLIGEKTFGKVVI